MAGGDYQFDSEIASRNSYFSNYLEGRSGAWPSLCHAPQTAVSGGELTLCWCGSADSFAPKGVVRLAPRNRQESTLTGRSLLLAATPVHAPKPTFDRSGVASAARSAGPAVGDLKALGRGSMLMRRALSLSILFLPRFSRDPRLLLYDVQP
jgi:hypothetical protein